jgi:hypothetical protein
VLFRRTWTRVITDVRNPKDVRLHLRRRDIVDRVLRLGNAPVGETRFDDRYVVLSKDKGYVMMIFEPAVRELMLRAEVEGVRLSGSTLELFYRREERASEHAAHLFDTIVAIADTVDRLGAGRT